MSRRISLVVAAIALAVAACAGGAGPSPSPASTPGASKSIPALKLSLVDTYGPLWFCDPDFYPIQRDDELVSAKARWAEVTADAGAFAALTTRVGVDPNGPFTDAATLVIYHQWKVLNAIALDSIGNDTYRFDYLAQPQPNATSGTRTGGTIRSDGTITVEQKASADAPICPICLARGSRVDTPIGAVAVEDLRIGNPVWTYDAAGRRIPGTVIAVGSTLAPASHKVVRLVLADGRALLASPGHPFADGRLIGDLRPGDVVDGATVLQADRVPYTDGRTFDLVASGPTGGYFVDGIALGSTLRP